MSPAAVLGEIWGTRRRQAGATSRVARADLSSCPLASTPLELSRAAAAPTSFALADLTDLTRVVADEVSAGRHPVHIDPLRRWYQLLRGDDFVDVWLISWATSQAAELHDHAGSLGALTVVSGSPGRATLDGRRAAHPQLASGSQRGVPAGARARRVEPGARARRERACLLAAADGDVVLRPHGRRSAAANAQRAGGVSSRSRCEE